MLTLPKCCYIFGLGNVATSASSKPDSQAAPCTLTGLSTSSIQLLWSTSARESTQTGSDTRGMDVLAGPAVPACQQFARLLVALPEHQSMRKTYSHSDLLITLAGGVSFN